MRLIENFNTHQTAALLSLLVNTPSEIVRATCENILSIPADVLTSYSKFTDEFSMSYDEFDTIMADKSCFTIYDAVFCKNFKLCLAIDSLYTKPFNEAKPEFKLLFNEMMAKADFSEDFSISEEDTAILMNAYQRAESTKLLHYLALLDLTPLNLALIAIATYLDQMASSNEIEEALFYFLTPHTESDGPEQKWIEPKDAYEIAAKMYNAGMRPAKINHEALNSCFVLNKQIKIALCMCALNDLMWSTQKEDLDKMKIVHSIILEMGIPAKIISQIPENDLVSKLEDASKAVVFFRQNDFPTLFSY
jgi:hypothetical protein